MNNFKIILENIQHINYLEYALDLINNSLFCLVGKNGIGKTTLIKSIQNFKDTSTLDESSRLNIINAESKIIYDLNDSKYTFTPFDNDGRYILDNSEEITKDLKNNFFTEFPIPYGKRFDIYSKLGGDVGETIKTKFATQQYDEKPSELIEILNIIYSTSKYAKLEQIQVKNENYYIEPLNSENYLREDDFSSGEFMIIQIYKLIKKQCKLIVIDELDISLDSSAQVKLIEELRKLTQKYSFNILFTTHSLALMKTMQDNELYFMENIDDQVIIEKKSYNYIKAELFQFTGYDRIILVEDKMLKSFIEYLLLDSSIFVKYEIIDIAGSNQTVDLMKRNKDFNFFGTRNVLTILDGDQIEQYGSDADIYCLPIASIEKYLYHKFTNSELGEIINGRPIDTNSIEKAKNLKKKSSALYYDMLQKGYLSQIEVFRIIKNEKIEDIQILKEQILDFLR